MKITEKKIILRARTLHFLNRRAVLRWCNLLLGFHKLISEKEYQRIDALLRKKTAPGYGKQPEGEYPGGEMNWSGGKFIWNHHPDERPVNGSPIPKKRRR